MRLLVDLHGVLAPITCQSNTNTIFMALESQVRKTYCSHIKCTIVCKEKNFRLTEAAQSEQGVLRLIWSGRLECVFVDPKGAKISKNGNKITCRLSKNKHFLFYTQGRGGNIMPATPS